MIWFRLSVDFLKVKHPRDDGVLENVMAATHSCQSETERFYQISHICKCNIL